ncbi:hypothetical protein GCM10009743_32770 [Kribbella swartbergensis]
MTGVDELLRQFRSDAGLTQEQLAERSGLSVEAIRTLEIGRRRHPRALTVSRLAEALDLGQADRDRLAQAARRSGADDSHRLPASVSDFVGREQQVRRLTGLLTRTTGSARPTSVVISAVTGMGGIGKTTLALHVGHLTAAEFPDGRIYVNLRGATEPIAPLHALGTLLRTLGVPPQEIPDDLDLAAARYRTVVSGRRILVVLDDAADADQVTPLIPGTPGSAAVVTSRRLLDGLAGAEHLRLDVLTDHEGLRLLGEVIGTSRVETDPVAAAEVVHRCGHLPLAIRIAGMRLPSRRPVSELAARLADESTRLGELTDGETGVRASIALSIHDLTVVPEDRAVAAAFPVLALLEPGDFPLRAAAAALELPIDETEAVLDRLVDVHLLEAPALHRYRLHDLVRAVGREGASAADERAVWERVLDCYRAMIWRADELDQEGPLSAQWKDTAWAAGARDLDDLEEIFDWLDAERATLVRLVRRAAQGTAEDRLNAVRIAVGMNVFGPARKRWLEWRDINRIAAGLVDARSDPIAAALVHFDLGLAYGELDDFPAASEHLAHAVDAAREIGNPSFLASGLVNLAHMLERAGRVPEAFSYIREALDLAEHDGEAAACSPWAYLTLGMLQGKNGEPALQAAAFEQAISLARDRHPAVLARVLVSAGASFRECGQPAKAVPVLTESLAVLREHDTRGSEGEALDELGTAYYELARYRQAADAYLTGLDIALDHQHWDREARIRTGLGRTYAELDRPADAREHWQLALDILTTHGMPAADDVRLLLSQPARPVRREASRAATGGELVL